MTIIVPPPMKRTWPAPLADWATPWAWMAQKVKTAFPPSTPMFKPTPKLPKRRIATKVDPMKKALPPATST